VERTEADEVVTGALERHAAGLHQRHQVVVHLFLATCVITNASLRAHEGAALAGI
jgi:hypothetical protein